MTERTLVLVKPDGVQRQLVGRVLQRYEDRGLKLVGLKLVLVDRSLAEAHYAVHRGTIRGDFALETAQNLVHASDSPENAAAEVGLWFAADELLAYERDVDRWVLAPPD